MCPETEIEEVQEAPYVEPVEAEALPEVEAPAAETETETPEAEVEAPAYEPNFKYSVLRKEKEIPEKFRSLIKNAEDEKELKELFEAADGLREHYRPKHEALEHAFTQINSEHSAILGSIQEARDAYARNDLDALFEKLEIPQQKVLQYAVDKLNYQDLPPEQKALIDARKMAERQNVDMQRQRTAETRGYQNQVQQAHDLMLNSELARPEVKSTMDAFDQRMGRPGAFLAEVANRGRLAWFQSNGRNVLTPSQAIEQVISLYGLKSGTANSTDQTTAPASAGTKKTTNTIPNVGGGRSAAPLKQKPRNIDDLKKMHKEMVAAEA